MSIASSHQPEISSHLTGLLAFHADLADWLVATLRTEPNLASTDLLALFLAECRARGIPETAYPFMAEDQGLADLAAYVQQQKSAQAEEPGELATLIPAPSPEVIEDETVNAPTNKMPALQMATRGRRQTVELASEASSPVSPTEDIANQETTRIPVVLPSPFPQDTPVSPEDVTEQATTRIPALKTTGPLSTEIANQETMNIPSLGPSTREKEQESIADVTKQETTGIPIIKETSSITENNETNATVHEEQKLSEEEAGEKKEAIEQQETAQISAVESRKEEAVEQQETAQIPVVETGEEDAQLSKTEEQSGQASPPAHESETPSQQETASTQESESETRGEPEKETLHQRARRWWPGLTLPVIPPGGRGRRGARKATRAPRTRRQRVIAALMLVLVLAPVLLLILLGINAYSTYRGLSDTAHSAVNHLLDVKNIFSVSSKDSANKSHLGEVFTVPNLQRAEQDFSAAGRDFRQLQQQLKSSSTLQLITTYLPQYSQTLASARAGSQIGIDVAAIGQIATAQAIPIAPTLSGSLLAATGRPLVTPQILAAARTTLDQITPLLTDIQEQSRYLSLDSLPISASEKTQAGQLLRLLPQVMSDLGIIHSLLNNAGWLLGVDQPRTFLVQTLDRAELRSTGGFTGQYGELTINAGRVAPFSLKDISLIEYTSTSANQGQLAPPQYRSWWPFANWGLRDSNISADFPTAAQQAMSLYKQETGHQVDGVINFTPIVIEHILAIIGPIQVPGYNTTVTAQNLEDVLHYYQLDNSGILKQIINQPGNTSTSDRKRFTNYLATLLMEKVRSAPPDQLLAIAHQLFADLQSRDLQMYFSDPGAEDMLVKYGYAGALDRSTTHDGWYVVQENLSASKASQYVQTDLQDTVTLDSQGGATHLLHIRLVYNQAGPVYGYDTYYDYLRVYVPPTSHLLAGDGFASDTPACGGTYGDCPINGVYAGSELTCPTGQYQPGATPPWLNGSNGGTWQPLPTLGGPTNTTSDESGRAMYGGWVIVPKNCTMNVTLSWYVPPIAGHPYSLLVQRQVGTYPELNLTILPAAATCTQQHTAGLYYDGVLSRDASFTLPAISNKQSCYPRVAP